MNDAEIINMKLLAEELKQYRKDNNLKIGDICRKTGLTYNTIGKILNAEKVSKRSYNSVYALLNGVEMDPIKVATQYRNEIFKKYQEQLNELSGKTDIESIKTSTSIRCEQAVVYCTIDRLIDKLKECFE